MRAGVEGSRQNPSHFNHTNFRPRHFERSLRSEIRFSIARILCDEPLFSFRFQVNTRNTQLTPSATTRVRTF